MGSTTSLIARTRIVNLLQRRDIVTPRMALAEGLDRKALERMARGGLLKRLRRGFYTYRDEPDALEIHPIAFVIAKPPKHSFACGPTAASVHKLLPALNRNGPDVFFLGIKRGARRLRGLRFIRWRYFSENRMATDIDWPPGQVGLSSPARSVVECFLLRRKLGELIPRQALARYVEKKHPPEEIERLSHLLDVFIPVMRAWENPLDPSLVPPIE